MNKGTLLLFLFLASLTPLSARLGDPGLAASNDERIHPVLPLQLALTVTPIALLVVLVFLVLAVLVAAAVLKAGSGGSASKDVPAAYALRESILTPAERSFAGVLESSMPDGVTWFAKIRLADVFVTRKGLLASQRASAWNRINQKHVDFLLVRASDLAPLAGIELDDSSHESEARKARDSFVDDVFHSCGLPLIHQRAQTAYNLTELRTTIAKNLKQ